MVKKISLTIKIAFARSKSKNKAYSRYLTHVE